MPSNNHIHDEILIGYITRSISDADRETIDDHLLKCLICRTRFSIHKNQLRIIDQEIRVEIDKVVPTSRMNFEKIASSIKPKALRYSFDGITTGALVISAIGGLVFAIIGLWQIAGSSPFIQPTTQNNAFPALACFCMMLVSMEHFDRSFTLRPRFIISIILTLILWLGTAIIGFLNILVLRDIALILSADAGRSAAEAGTTAIFTVIIAAIAFIIMVIGGAEYHYRMLGQPNSWKVFLWTIIFQLLVFLTPYFLW
jgi:hypothetical protein